MTGREQVIKTLDEIAEYFRECRMNVSFGSKAENRFFELQNAARDAQELLKEQEPKPVKITKNSYNYEFYYCPNCNRSFDTTYYKRPLYCDKCGQAVKWDESQEM